MSTLLVRFLVNLSDSTVKEIASRADRGLSVTSGAVYNLRAAQVAHAIKTERESGLTDSEILRAFIQAADEANNGLNMACAFQIMNWASNSELWEK